ncbi:LANO_0F08020g1_1 [Lachancea nothofagi CBS 11611]|uniref:LANO_0F08020g1_1 n=1 Tax=Lachancea nothofagi CBS 11611 TaxID=1266666 RepID=A0A1G4K995_9SACH|nr:LANO_0F08020g1_1 [Lachancea nothofagi CBS 11611]
MSQNLQVKRKRTRTLDAAAPRSGAASHGAVPQGMFLDNDADPIIGEMLARQSALLQGNLIDSHFGSMGSRAPQGVQDSGSATAVANENFHDHNVNEDNEEDDDLIFVKEQPAQPPLPLDPQADHHYTSKKFKKQRTISLPQLPHAKLLYEAAQYRALPRRQNDDDLIHLSGSSTKTIDGNRAVTLNVVRSVSPLTAQDQYPSSPVFKRMATAPKISKLVSAGKKKLKREFFQTDKEGHYVYREDDIFCNSRFVVKELLGQGTFGKVVQCIDHAPTVSCNYQRESEFHGFEEDPFAQSFEDSHFDLEYPTSDRPASSNYPKLVAVKIIRAVDRYREAAKTELRVLKAILDNDPMGQYQCLLLRECFDYKNHICLVTDLFGKSVYDFMCNNGCPRFPGSHVQAISKQLIRSVCFLHDLGIIHTDLKPENVLLCDETYVGKPLSQQQYSTLSPRRKSACNGERKFLTNPEVKLIDFGSAVFHNEFHPAVISTRHYRAPEIVLGLGWSFPCDIWSTACVLVELVTGESLYPIHENLEHMAMMQRFNGRPFPPKIVENMFYKADRKLGNMSPDLNATVVKHFDRETLALQWPERNSKGEILTKERSMKRILTSCDRLDKYILQKIRQDYGEWLIINWDLSPEDNWALLESKFDEQVLDREVFLFWYWFLDLCKKMFEFDPTKRITAREAINHEWFNYGILDEGIASFGKVKHAK